MNEEEKKISLPEIIFIIGLGLLAELFDIIDFGWLIGFPLQFWLIMKGGIGFKNQATLLAGNLIELIPVLDWLPIRIVALIITIYLINHPKISEIMPTKISGKISK
ncbi:hypothetical protein HZC33_02725 [Candidatus Wolfebacteria bacterium]|nr:hypothetical protein [Candidatus Wolfebacteria bacterium]